MIAFDLDGVLVTDFDRLPMIGGELDFFKMSTYIFPVFNPTGEYVILTGRTTEFRSYTEEWVDKYLDPKPLRIFHERHDMLPNDYKAMILNSHPEITRYIESDPKTVAFLQQQVTTGCVVEHFATFIRNAIDNKSVI